MYVFEQTQNLLHGGPLLRRLRRAQVPDSEALHHLAHRVAAPPQPQVERTRPLPVLHQPPHAINVTRIMLTSQQLHQHDTKAVHVILRGPRGTVLAHREIGDPRLEVVRQQDVRRHQVAVHHGLRQGVVEVGEATRHPEGNAVARVPLHLLGGGPSTDLPRVGAPVLDVGGPCWELVQPTVEIPVGHELVQYQLLFTCAQGKPIHLIKFSFQFQCSQKPMYMNSLYQCFC